MRIPDPKANTTTEAYLAYKAGYLTQGELKPVLYEPYLHFDAWLAYWCELTNEYPLDDNGNPEMLCDEEALVAYLAGVTDTYPEEIKDPYDVRIVGYLRHLANAELPAPDYPVNNSEFYLSELGNVEEESVFTSLPGTFSSSGQYLIDYTIYGNTLNGDCGDQTRNLFDNMGPWWYTQRYLNSSGGTASNSGFNVTNLIQVAPNTVYRLQRVNGSSSNPAICFYDENKEYISGIAYNKAVSITVTTPANCMYVRFSVKRDLLDSAMFHLGGTDIAYEPYGFLLPISMNGTTTVATLRYPLRKIGDVADYINYAEQKMYQYINNGTVLDNPIVRSITLPEIGISAENTVDVLTMVKPSKVVLKYDKA